METKRRILISVTNKSRVELFGQLVPLGYEIVSTGGTAAALAKACIAHTLVENITGFPEMLNGRLKTLHPKVFGGILAARGDPTHMEAIAAHSIAPIDIVVVNLYDFAKNHCIENIDIGGPSLIRAAAKNWYSVTVLTDPEDYEPVIAETIAAGDTLISSETRERLAGKAFALTAKYDAAIAAWFKERTQPSGKPAIVPLHPERTA